MYLCCPQAYLHSIHTHTLYIQKRKVLFGFYSPPVISLLVQATKKHWANGWLLGLHLDFSWEACVNFPCIKKERQKMKALGAYKLRFLQKCLHWIMIQGYASLRGWQKNCLFEKHFCFFYKITIESNFLKIAQGLACGPITGVPAEVRFQGKHSPLWMGLCYPASPPWQ